MDFSGSDAVDLASPEEIRRAKQTDKLALLPASRQDAIDLPYNLHGPIPKTAPNNGQQAAEFIRRQHSTDTDEWWRKCLILQRMARLIPPSAPTAFAASQLVPESERVYKIKDLRRGMVAFTYDASDPDTAGHVLFINGRDDKNRIITGSNDVYQSGHVDYVFLKFYMEHWGHTFQFGATMLNGYDFADFNEPAKPVKNYGTLGERYEATIDELKKIRHDKERREVDTQLIRALTRDINRMEEHLKRFSS